MLDVLSVLIKITVNAGMSDPSRLSGGLSLEYSRRRVIAEFGTNCSTLSREKTCKRSCL